MLRGRFGYIVNPSLAILLSLGAALADVDYTDVRPGFSESGSNHLWGAVFGATAAIRLSPRTRFRAEYLHVDFQQWNFTSSDFHQVKFDLDIFRLSAVLVF